MITSILDAMQLMENDYKGRYAFQYINNDEVTKVTFEQFTNDIKNAVGYLKQSFGCEKKHFGILARNSYHYAVMVYAIWLNEGVVVPFNYEESWEKIKQQLEFTDIDYLFTDGEYKKRVSEFEFENEYSIDDYMSYTGSEVEFPTKFESVDDLSLILLTSGTTGIGKAVMLSQRNIFTSTDSVAYITTLVQTDVVMGTFNLLPFYHSAGLLCLTSTNYLGKVMTLCNDTKYMYRDLNEMESNHTSVPPIVLNAWNKELQRGRKEKIGNIETIACGAAELSDEIIENFKNNGMRVFPLYGMTETFGGGTANLYPEKKLKSVGKPFPNFDVKLEDNEILIKSDASMLGYYKNEDETRKTLVDGWIHTGDLGYFDEDGDLFINGRKKNLIILASGENVNPEELERKLNQCPYIAECVVKEKNQKITAVIYSEEEKKDDIKEYVTGMNKSLPLYMRINEIEFSENPLEKTSVGKIKRGV